MTQQPPLLVLQGNAGRKWTLHSLQTLSPNVALVKDAASNALVVVKTLALPDEHAVRLVLADVAAWRRACSAAPELVVKLLDVCQEGNTLHLLMEYCSGGSLYGVVKPERAALRVASNVAAALGAVLLHSGQSAHANISTANVLVTGAAVKLAGWGWTRARRLAKRKLNEKDDVKALAAVLYEILYGERYDAAVGLPADQRVSKGTKELLRNALANAMDLTVFRYDLMAARGMLPVCGSALKPLVNSRREEHLGNDLDSVRGLRQASEEREVIEERNTNGVEEEPAVRARPGPVTNGAEENISQVVKKLVAGEVVGMEEDLVVERLIEACAKVEEMPEKVFKVLFTLPISKNPLIAFKTVALIHRLLAEGVAKLTALAITHDGFLSWIQTQWSVEKVKGRGAKAHMLTYCFGAGEISVYTAILRKRIEVQARFAKLVSTHWVPRPDGLSGLPGKGEVVRGVRQIVESCAVLLRMLLASKDPMAANKTAAVPMLVAEMSKTYLMICWLYATAEAADKGGIREELEAAHRSTRAMMEIVKTDQEIAEKCASNVLLELEENVPKMFDVSELVTALRKKKRKKKKKKIAAPVQEPEVVSNDDEKSPGVSEGEEEPKPPSEDNEEPVEHQEVDDEEMEEESPSTKPVMVTRQEPGGVRGVTEKRHLYAARVNGEGQYGRVGEVEVARGEVARMAKLSLSVRGATSQPMNGYEGVVNGRAVPRRRSPQRGRSLSPVIERRSAGTMQGRSPRNRVYVSESDEDEDEVHGNGSEEVRSRQRRGNTRRVRRSSRDNEGRDSESESEEEQVKRKTGRGRKAKGRKQRDSSDEGSNDDGSQSSDSEPKKRRDERKRSPKKKSDEKKIPFDKETPAKKKIKEKAASKAAAKRKEEEYTGGSKEALAAAASGKKTPNMNPKFEVAPFEVQYGPQIGSGGFGVVFKAKFRSETVAVKKIHAHALSNAASVAEFQSEVAVLCTLRHPNILRFVGACTKPPHLMIITEFMSRGTLFDVLHQSQMRVTWPMRKKFALDTCKGMRYLHNSKLLHRDLKSSNLMLDKDFNCKVGDFGLTRISRGAAAAQMTGQCGTFQYMAVEVLANKPYSEKADVFSFGILLWEMVARKLPYFGMQPMQVGMAVLQQGMRPPIPEKCPAPLAKLMRACWDSDPNRRPSFAQLVQALEAMPE